MVNVKVREKCQTTKAKEKAREVVCKSNLHQWGVIFQMYTDSNNGRFHEGWRGPSDYSGLWLHALRPYYTTNNDVRTCPTATKLPPGTKTIGGAKIAWGKRSGWVAGSDDPYNYGSYGLNGYVCSDELNQKTSKKYWRRIAVKGDLSRIPILLDSAYWKTYPQETNPPAPIYDYLLETQNPANPSDNNVHENYMASHCIDRHSGRINVVFFDLSADKVGLKSLWSLQWNPVWEKKTPRDWPDWMSRFKE